MQYKKIALSFIFFSLTLCAEEIQPEEAPLVVESMEIEQPIGGSEVIEDRREMQDENRVDIEPIENQERTPSPLLTLIEEVKSSEGENRRELMNQLKLQLREMNKEKRIETMQLLKHSFSKESCQGENHSQHKNRPQNEHRGYQHERHQPQFRPMHGMGQGGGHHR